MATPTHTYDYALDWVRRMVDDGPLPVGVFGAATSSGVQEIAAFGTDGGRRAAVDDQFALFSVTKPIVGLATMRAVERGLLSLDLTLGAVVPELAATPAAQITLEQLLSHRSGLVDPPLDSADPRALLPQAHLMFPPGTMTQYCNLAFIAIERMLESATGVPLVQHIAAFNDLDGVETLALTDGSGREAHHVHGTEAAGLDFPALAKAVHPAAGAYAQASDLLALGSTLLRTGSEPRETAVVHPSTLAAMRTSRTTGLPRLNARPTDARDQNWGLTFNLNSSPAILEHEFYGHNGWSGCQFWVYPEHDACFVLLTNLLDVGEHGIRIDELHNAFAAGLVRAG